MAIFLYSDNELIPYTLGDILSDPIRAEFLVSDTETIFDVIIELPTGELEEYSLPYVTNINDQSYYSLPYKMFVSIDLGISGVDEETPTPTLTPSPSLTPVLDNSQKNDCVFVRISGDMNIDIMWDVEHFTNLSPTNTTISDFEFSRNNDAIVAGQGNKQWDGLYEQDWYWQTYILGENYGIMRHSGEPMDNWRVRAKYSDGTYSDPCEANVPILNIRDENNTFPWLSFDEVVLDFDSPPETEGGKTLGVKFKNLVIDTTEFNKFIDEIQHAGTGGGVDKTGGTGFFFLVAKKGWSDSPGKGVSCLMTEGCWDPNNNPFAMMGPIGGSFSGTPLTTGLNILEEYNSSANTRITSNQITTEFDTLSNFQNGKDWISVDLHKQGSTFDHTLEDLVEYKGNDELELIVAMHTWVDFRQFIGEQRYPIKINYNGHVFLTKAELQTAVDAWDADSISATETYGDISTWNVSAITDMSLLFRTKQNITSLDLSGWDTSNVTNMRYMFQRMNNLESINVSDFDTSSVTSMRAMFETLPLIESYDLSAWDTSNVTDMAYMFWNPGGDTPSRLQTLNLSGNFKTTNVTDMSNMFGINNSNLSSIIGINDFDTRNVTNMRAMFYGVGLTSLDLSNFKTNNVTNSFNIDFMFSGCTSLTSVGNLSGWCVTNITSEPSDFAVNSPWYNTQSNRPVWGTCPTPYTFLTKAELQTAVDAWNVDSTSATETYGDISTWNVSAITDMNSLFSNKQNITSLDLSGWDTSNVTNMGRMFQNCYDLTSLTLGTSFDTSSVTIMWWMFHDCRSLTSLDLSSFDTSGVTSMISMFGVCQALTSLNLSSSFKTSGVTGSHMASMFKGCRSLTSLDLSSFDTRGVTDMGYMFRDCRNLTSLDLSSFDISSVTEMDYMFESCWSLTSLDLSSFDTSNVTNMTNMFRACSALTSVGDLSSWCVTNITSEPTDFATNSPWYATSSNRPVWGTCPSS